MSTFFDDALEFCTAFGEWVFEHRLDIFVALIIGACVIAVLWNVSYAATQHRQQVDLCARAFEYSRDQCEFIVSNHTMVAK